MNSTNTPESQHVVEANCRGIDIVLQSGGMEEWEFEELFRFFRDGLVHLRSAPPSHYRWWAKVLCRLSRLIRRNLGRSLDVRVDRAKEAIGLFREASEAIETSGNDNELQDIIFNIRNRADLLEKKIRTHRVAF
jgi:hypothetical protein